MEPLPRSGTARAFPAWVLPVATFGAAAAVRGTLAAWFPTIHGGDAAARLAQAGTLVLGYQLPLPQVFVTVGRSLSNDPLVARFIFCLWGAFLAAGLATLMREVGGGRAGFFAGLLLVFDPVLIHYSIVPYQEPLAYGFLAWSLVAQSRKRPWMGAALMGAATLCRYETWLFLPLLLRHSRSRLPLVLAGAPVLAWTWFWGGLAPRGLYVLDIDPGASRLPRISFLLGKLIEYETALPSVLAILAVVLWFKSRSREGLVLVAWVSAAVAVIVGLGHEFPPGSGLMSERLIHLPVLLSIGLASVTLARASRMSPALAAVCVGLALALVGRNLRFEVELLRAAAREPDLALARETARAIEEVRRPGECVSVDAPRVDPAQLQSYVAKVGASWGDVATAKARAVALLDASPDRDRIAAHLRARPGTVREGVDCALHVSVDGSESAPPRSRLLAETTAGRRRARLYRIHD
jgi:hypothetical protein